MTSLIHLGKDTSNMAEYVSLTMALILSQLAGIKRVSVFTDSQLVAQQFNGKFKVKVERIKYIYDVVKQLEKSFEKDGVEVVWVPREMNTMADRAATLASRRASLPLEVNFEPV